MSPPKKESLLIISLPLRFQEKKSITIVLMGTSHLILSCYVIVMHVSILLLLHYVYNHVVHLQVQNLLLNFLKSFIQSLAHHTI